MENRKEKDFKKKHKIEKKKDTDVTDRRTDISKYRVA